MQTNIVEDDNPLEKLEFNAIVTTMYKMIGAIPDTCVGAAAKDRYVKLFYQGYSIHGLL